MPSANYIEIESDPCFGADLQLDHSIPVLRRLILLMQGSQKLTSTRALGTSALPPTADIGRRGRQVSSVPKRRHLKAASTSLAKANKTISISAL